MGRHPQMRRRSLTAEAVADGLGAARDAAESEGTKRAARVKLWRPTRNAFPERRRAADRAGEQRRRVSGILKNPLLQSRERVPAKRLAEQVRAPDTTSGMAVSLLPMHVRSARSADGEVVP